MMIADDDFKLDQLLQQWSESVASSGDLNKLHDRIVCSLNGTATDDQEEISVPVLRGTTEVSTPEFCPLVRSRQAAGLAVSVALMLLVCLGYFGLAEWSQRVVLPASDLPPDYAWLREGQIQNKAILLSEMEGLFDSQLIWLAETGDRVEFGLDKSTAGGDPGTVDGTRLAVRVVVQRRQSGTSDWKLAWAIDVVSRTEELVTITPSTAQEDELRMWTYRLPDGMIAIDTELQLDGSKSFRAATSGVQEDRKPLLVVSGHDNGTEYRLFQTVAVLDGKVI